MIKKAVILAAGKGTRMHPITKVVPKPMLPILTHPALDYLIEECTIAGIEEILMIVGHQKELIIQYYENHSNISFVEQKELNGTGGALELAKDFVSGEDFALIFADELIDSKEPVLKAMVELFDSEKAPYIGALSFVPKELAHKYNSVTIEKGEYLSKIISIVEKPENLGHDTHTLVGRYVFSGKIFDYLEDLVTHSNGEKYLTDVFELFIQKSQMFGYPFEGKRFDIGYEQGWFETNKHFYEKKDN